MDPNIRYGIVIEAILPFLSTREVLNCSSSCQVWYHVINNDNLLWKRLCSSEINASSDYWDWQDAEEWTLGTPCQWKRVLLNYLRTKRNMLKNRCKEFNLPSKKVDNIRSFVAAYDGKTLLIPTIDGLNVYKVHCSNIEHFQSIESNGRDITNAKTNTDFIIVCFNGYPHIYELTSGYYEMCYSLELEHGLTMIETYSPKGERTQKFSCLRFAKDKLIINHKEPVECYGWSLTEKALQFRLVGYECIKCVNQIVVVIDSSKLNIRLFDSDFSPLHDINLSSPLYNYFVSGNLLNTLQKRHSYHYLSSWEVHTGEMYLTERLLPSLNNEPVRILSVSKSIFLILEVRNDLTILKFETGHVLWKINLKHSYPLPGTFPTRVYRNFQKIFLVYPTSSSLLTGSTKLTVTVANHYTRNYVVQIMDLYGMRIQTDLFSSYRPKLLLRFPEIFKDLIVNFNENGSLNIRFYR